MDNSKTLSMAKQLKPHYYLWQEGMEVFSLMFNTDHLAAAFEEMVFHFYLGKFPLENWLAKAFQMI